MLRARHRRSAKDKKDGDGLIEGDSDVKAECEEDQLAEDNSIATASHYLGKTGGVKRKDVITVHNTPKKRRKIDTDSENGELPDVYCWECHKSCVSGDVRDCSRCPRTWHGACMAPAILSPQSPVSQWICPVCKRMAEAESDPKKAFNRMGFTDDDLLAILSHAWRCMRHVDSEPFQHPVPASLVPDYYDLVFYPMDLSTVEKKIRNGAYRSTDAFLEDVKWIVHNSHIYNGATSKYTNDAKLIIKICKHEMSELELCPDCYRYSTLKPTTAWFTNPCKKPHCLVWAKLKGFPFWPAKALRLSQNETQVDVRFFGEHDRAWIPVKDCFLVSEEAPASPKSIKKRGLDNALEELRDHVHKLRAKFGSCHLAPVRTPFLPRHLHICPLLLPPSSAASSVSSRDQSTVGSNKDDDDENSYEGGDEEEGVKSLNGNSNGVFEMAEAFNQQLSADAETEAVMNTEKVSSQLLPSSVDGTGILEKLQNTLDNVNSHSPSPAASANGDRKGCEGEANVQRKHNLHKLVQKMATQTAAAPKASTAPLRPLLPKTAMVLKKLPSQTVTGRSGISASNVAHPRLSHQQKLQQSNAAVGQCEQRQAHLASRLQSTLAKNSPVKNASVSRLNNRPSASTGTPARHSAPPRHNELSALFQKHADKICNFLKNSFSGMINDVRQLQSSQTQVDINRQSETKAFRAELDGMKRLHETSLAELRTVTNEAVGEVRRSFEMEKRRIVTEMQKSHDKEKQALVADIKSKQWCANCPNEAAFYCCWNTSYCGYDCQQKHWPTHQNSCAQIRNIRKESGCNAEDILQKKVGPIDGRQRLVSHMDRHHSNAQTSSHLQTAKDATQSVCTSNDTREFNE